MDSLDNKWKEFAECLLRGDEQEAYQLIVNENRDSVQLYAGIVTPAMQYIGELWQKDRISVAEEHLATSVCDFVLSHYGFQFKKGSKDKGKLFLLCLEKEQHMLGTKMVASLCEEKGWEVRMLGANLPLEYALSLSKEWEPDVIGLSAATPHRLPLVREYVEKLKTLQSEPDVIVGGRLASLYDLKKYCGEETVFFTDLYKLEQWLDDYHEGANVNGAS